MQDTTPLPQSPSANTSILGCSPDILLNNATARLLTNNSRSKHELLLNAYASMKMKEQWFLEKVLASANGSDEPHPYVRRDELVRSLGEDYESFGIAQAPWQARVLINDFELALRRVSHSPARGS